MKHIRIFIWKLAVFGDEIFNIFEYACFRNEKCWKHSFKFLMFVHDQLLCFWHLKKVFFCMVHYSEVNLQLFVMIQCKTFCWYYTFCSVVLKNIQNIHFPHSKNGYKIDRVGVLDARFQQVPLVKNSEIFTVMLWNIHYENTPIQIYWKFCP